MEPTVSGNKIHITDDSDDSVNETPINPDKEKETDKNQEPVTNNYTYETYEIDNSEVCEILNKILSESVKTNEALERLADSLDAVNETLTAEPEETELEDVLPEEPEETVSGNDALFEMLKGMEETFVGIKETSKSIYETVSGNTLYLEDLNNTSQEFMESYTEVSEKQSYKSIYGISIGICILFVVGCIAGLNIAKLVWGKMR